MNTVTDVKTKDLTSYKLQHLTLKFTYPEIADKYDVSRQYIHILYERYVEKELIPSSFPMDSPIAIGFHYDRKLHVQYNLSVISLHDDGKRILMSVNDETPRWNTVYINTKGIYFKWSYKHGTNVRRYGTYIVDFKDHKDDFKPIDNSKWLQLIEDIETNNTN